MNSPHIPVLLDEVLQTFKDINDGVIIDCTLGYAGHSCEILKQNKNVKILACDKDEEAINFSKNKLLEFKDRVEIHKCNFSELLEFANFSEIRGVLADIGVSSLQLDKNERGFSIQSDSLDMRMNKSQELDAKIVVNTYSKFELERILKDYAEIKNSSFIAQKIINARANKMITSSKELAQIIGTNNIKGRHVSPAVLAFQAIRIEVNKELEELQKLLNEIKNSNIDNAKVAIITFHSLEDRIVKNAFRDWQKSCICPDMVMRCECGNNHSIGKNLTSKPIIASAKEIKNNPRSNCAKMRVFEIKRNFDAVSK